MAPGRRPRYAFRMGSDLGNGASWQKDVDWLEVLQFITTPKKALAEQAKHAADEEQRARKLIRLYEEFTLWMDSKPESDPAY